VNPFNGEHEHVEQMEASEEQGRGRRGLRSAGRDLGRAGEEEDGANEPETVGSWSVLNRVLSAVLDHGCPSAERLLWALAVVLAHQYGGM